MGRLLTIAILVLSVAGCTIPHTRVIVPDPALKSDTERGFQTEQDRHDIREVNGTPTMVPGQVWIEEALPFGQNVHIEWDTAGYPFVNEYWCPFGVPTFKGEHGCWQTYTGVKEEGGKKKRDYLPNGWAVSPMEFHPIEQNAWRWKSDLEIGCTEFNMAGCIVRRHP